ncbi:MULTISPECIES: IS3 family transposase [unclassified Fusobacterium]|uniref:IS3 family transposase n=1 Tax=unclassified Fusobacterium TaxID=2648384 RepID=UPI0020123DCC|nr:MULTISPECIES: IS3 family transposase [unclassified Fusobacterium]
MAKHYDEDLKKQLVKIYNQGNYSYRALASEYGLSTSTLRDWVIKYNNTGSFNIDDNRTEEEKELIRLRKQLKQLEMENDILKQAALLLGQKIDLIISNRDKYSISAMSRLLGVTRSLVYYHLNKEKDNRSDEDEKLIEEIKEIFRKSRNNYGTRKIRKELRKIGYKISRRKIGRIMKENGLVSNYTVAQYKVVRLKYNEEDIPNLLNREFDNREYLEAIVSDLTYVRVGRTWNYICLIIDLNNREIIGYSAGQNKDANLVAEAFYSIRQPLNRIKIFHTDRGREFKNIKIEEILNIFGIKRSLSEKGSPYDNAVSEAVNKVMKTEFIYQEKFNNLQELKLKLAEYVYWYNNLRIHGSLGYKTPVEYRKEV